MKGGRTQYYVCGGYLRKGKEYCPYVGWNKEKVEELVATRLRIALMRLMMNDNLAEELKQFFNESNQHKIAQKTTLDNEIAFLLKRIQLIEADIQSGKAKSYHQDMLAEMYNELGEKREELKTLRIN
jgi:site-specific DNA recombinase